MGRHRENLAAHHVGTADRLPRQRRLHLIARLTEWTYGGDMHDSVPRQGEIPLPSILRDRQGEGKPLLSCRLLRVWLGSPSPPSTGERGEDGTDTQSRNPT